MLPLTLSPRPSPSAFHARTKFTAEEDLRLRNLVSRLGCKNWDDIAHLMANRTARQCRDRYKNYLADPSTPSPWLPEEDAVIVREFQETGPRWVEIAKLLRGRTAIHVKNRWHRHLCKREAPAAPPSPAAAGHFFPAPPKAAEAAAQAEAPKEQAPEAGGLDWDQILPRARAESVRGADSFSDWYF
jgi:hypothetical protein